MCNAKIILGYEKMKLDGSSEVEKSEKTHVNKRQSTAEHRPNLVVLDNIRKEIIRIEKKCEKNQIKYGYLSGKKVKRLVEEYLDGLHDDVDRKKYMNESELSSAREILRGTMKPSTSKIGTSSAKAYWSSSSNHYNLEVFGFLYISPQRTILPLDQCGVTHQKFIHLG